MPTRVVTTSSTLPEPQHAAATTLILDPDEEQNMQGSPGYGPSAGFGPTSGYLPDTPNSGVGGSINYSQGNFNGMDGTANQPGNICCSFKDLKVVIFFIFDK